jgi:cytochrome P450
LELIMPNQNGLVGPKGHFLLGNLPEFKKDELAFLTRCAQGYGEIVPLRLLHLSVYLLLNPDHIEYVLNAHSRDFVKSRMYKIAARLVKQGLVLSEGDYWLRQRRLIQPAFHKERIAAYGQIMVDYTERMLSTWQEGQILDAQDTMVHLSMAIVMKALFNCDVDNDPEGAGDVVRSLFKEAAALFANPMAIPENIPTPGNLRYRRVAQQMDKIVYHLIQQHRAKAEDTGDLLSMLLRARDESQNGMTDQELRDEMITMLAASFETTGTALCWAWYLLSQHPAVEAKLLAELEAVLGGRAPTVEDLPKLPYTEMILIETLRFYPPGPLQGREAVKDFELGGYHFSAGTEFWISPLVLHRSARYYEAPDEFRPERWEGDLIKQLPKFAYMPFLHGPRQCIGNVFASMEVRLILATVAQKFKLKLVPEQVVVPKFSLTLNPKYGLKMSVAQRGSAPQTALPANLRSASSPVA